jgi:cystathionine gamma-synthase
MAAMPDPRRLDTLALHADHGVEPTADVAPPIHVTTTFTAGEPSGLYYARDDQPTRRRLEAVLSALEGGAAVTYASGQAATHAALSVLRPPRVVIGKGGYHATHAVLAALGVPEVPLGAPLQPGDLVWLETPRNPTCELVDVAAYVERARAAGARVAVDSTFATPVLQSPLQLGADLVMHASTKFLGGHSDALGGVLVARDPELGKALHAARTVTGGVMGALETWLTLRGVRTLALRVRRQSDTAARLARFLEPRVARVWHPSLASHPGHALARTQMRGGGPMLSIELSTEAAAKALPGALRLFQDATSLGGVESLAEWRRKWDPEAAPGLVRLSVGLEDPEDLEEDLARALAAVGEPSRATPSP